MLTAALIILSAFSLQSADYAHASTLVRLSEALETEALRRASTLSQAPAAPSPAIDHNDTMMIELAEFALSAHRLSRTIDQSGGPMDLRCIFRGMSEDANHRAELLTQSATRADHARVYQEIAQLSRQAAEIAAAPELAQAAVSTYACPVEG